MVLHHVSLGTNDLRRAKAFYDPLMSELGLRLIKETERIIAYGSPRRFLALRGQ
jgi:catechol 2,3-dioxygenase-like lactoylglutathione lyase family enzyme